ncbi:MAG: prephenate dehydratase [Proteobacteria bacterium]|nr:prephenate dehydratase [Pseudomonadota bacterium]
MTQTNRIAFQGLAGAYSHLACIEAYPDMEPLPCVSFDAAFEAVENGAARLAMIPIENTVAGRVADIHHLLPDSGLHIIAEHFQRVTHQLLGLKGATIDDLKTVHSHIHALPQCRKLIQELGLEPLVHADTAGAAAELAASGDRSAAVIASSLAAETYGLEILRSGVEDADNNTTRFVVMAKEPADPEPGDGPVMTTFVFRVRNVPAALYKALGGFATNGVNMVKLESYMTDGAFTATQFYADIEGHPSDTPVRLALEELGFFTRTVKVLGVYPANPFRFKD